MDSRWCGYCTDAFKYGTKKGKSRLEVLRNGGDLVIILVLNIWNEMGDNALCIQHFGLKIVHMDLQRLIDRNTP